MVEFLIIWMNVMVASGGYEARPYIRLRDGSQCEFLLPRCIMRAEDDYGVEKVDAARRRMIDDVATECLRRRMIDDVRASNCCPLC